MDGVPGMASTNGGLKAATYVLSGTVLILGGALLTAYAGAASHISRTDAQEMVDRGDNTIKERLKRIETKLDQLIAVQGQNP